VSAEPDNQYGAGPPPGGFMAATERWSQSIAGGYGRGSGADDTQLGPAAQRRALHRLLGGLAMLTVLAALVQFGAGIALLTIEVVVVVLIAIIMLHELGHLLVAKRCGIKATEYFVGFGPKLWSVRRGETEYGIKPVLLGGYVRIIGMNNMEEIDPADEQRTYRAQPWTRRVAVSLAGPAVHFVLAFLLLLMAVGVFGVDTPLPQVGGLGALADGHASPAQQAGLKKGDKFVSVDGHPVKNWDMLVGYIQSKANVPIAMQIDRAGHVLNLTVTPVDANKVAVKDASGTLYTPDTASPSVGVIGVDTTILKVRADPVTAVGRAAVGLVRGTGQTVIGLGRIFSPHGLDNLGQQVVTGQSPTKRPSAKVANDRPLSVIGVGRLATQAAHQGVNSVLALLVILNLFLGVFNLIPLLPFDGGHIAIAIYERVRSRRGQRYQADVTKMLPVTYALLLVVIFLGLSTMYLDLASPVANPFR